MVIALNAGSNPNGQAPSIGVHGDGKDAENSLFGNFGDLLTLISADAENALHENNPEAKLTAKQTNEALLALVEGGSDDTKLAISSILKRVAFEDPNQLDLPVKEDIQTSSFLEAKIESKLEQQNLLKPLKELEFFSLADLESFVKGLEQSNVEVLTESPLNKNSVLIDTPLAGIAADMDKEHYASAAGAVVTTSDLVSNAVVATSPDIFGTTSVSRISEPFSVAVGIDDPISVANYPVDEKDQIIPVGEKDQIILDVVQDILQVNSETLTISKKGPSEVIFDLRDLKEVILQKFPSSSPSEKEVKLPLELVIPYT